MPRGITVRAYAKINLHLRVGQRDPASGYHALETLFQTVGLFDTIRVTPARGLRLAGPSGDAPRGDPNLTLRAARALQAAAGHGEGARIHLTKRIPVAAGLGGGSSDAAAVLIALDLLWHTQFTYRKLIHIAKQLGADVPFLLRGGCALGTGRGDRLQALRTSPQPVWCVLVTSARGASTAEAYAALGARDKARGLTMAARRPSAGLRRLARAWQAGRPPEDALNSFERTAFAARPRLRDLRDVLRARGALLAQLSGSGPTVFGLFHQSAEARAAAAALRLRRHERVFLVRTVPASPVMPARRGRSP